MSNSNMDAPPPYETSSSGHLKPRSGIPPLHRRSMEDEVRPLPPNWVRQFDPQTHHQFFVDTSANPPRSIWHHPYDDPDYLSTLSPEERERVSGLHRVLTPADMEAESTDDEADHHNKSAAKGVTAAVAGAQAGSSSQTQPQHKESSLGRRMKDKLTGTTHEQREAARRQREEEERRLYELHRKIRTAMARAMETGQPQYLGKDRDGKDIYIEPPAPYAPGYGGGYYGGGATAFNPYTHGGPYASPNARFIRPGVPYSRPYGYGYGGGLGLPVAGGLLGGMMLGGLMF